MIFPDIIYADTDLVCGEDQKDGYEKYIRADRVQELPFRLPLAEILRYHRGLGKYDFSKFSGQERDVARLESWEKLQDQIIIALASSHQ